jgi:L-alanine-DL-glutamate epimerase-like enolase superfamily enzyme
MLTELVDHPIPVDRGFIDVPERPGLGIELNMDAVDKYPFDDNGIWVPWPRT